MVLRDNSGMNRGAIILCGGKSSRMATDKALLPFGDESMLARVVRIVCCVIDASRVAVVAAVNQQLPELDPAIRLVRDSVEFAGPLAAISNAKSAIEADAVFVTGCDTPLLKPEHIEFLFAQLGDHAAIVPEDAGRMYSLCGVYRVEVFNGDPKLRSMRDFVKHINAKRVDTDLLRAIDPELLSLRNINTRQDYFDALVIAGLSTP
jgi:molybdopterin-guanine dinucleotide biosynthesis protein A